MPVDVSEEEYFAALTELLDTADPFADGGTHSISQRMRSNLLHWAYEHSGPQDETRPSDMLECLDSCDARLALTVIAGRSFHGRPHGHPRYKELLAFCDLHRAFKSRLRANESDPGFFDHLADDWLRLRFGRVNPQFRDRVH